MGCEANPCQKMTMQFMLAADLLAGKEGADLAFIEAAPEMVVPNGEVTAQASESKAAEKNTVAAGNTETALFQAVLKGNKKTERRNPFAKVFARLCGHAHTN